MDDISMVYIAIHVTARLAESVLVIRCTLRLLAVSTKAGKC